MYKKMIGMVAYYKSPMPFPFLCCGSTSCVVEKVAPKNSNQMLITTTVAQKPVTFVVKAPPPPPETPEDLYKKMSEKIANERAGSLEPVVLERRIVVKEKSYILPCILLALIASVLVAVFGRGSYQLQLLENITKGDL
jgi:hypothetical protein